MKSVQRVSYEVGTIRGHAISGVQIVAETQAYTERKKNPSYGWTGFLEGVFWQYAEYGPERAPLALRIIVDANPLICGYNIGSGIATGENIYNEEMGALGYVFNGLGIAGIFPLSRLFSAGNAAKGSGNVLRHYTSEAGCNAMMESKVLNPAIGVKNARHGSGQYLTDIASESLIPGQLSRRLFGVPWNGRKVSHFIEIDVVGLNVIKNAPGNYLIPGTNGLPLDGRIINGGATIFK